MTTKLNNFWLSVKKGFAYFYEEFIKFPGYLISHPIKGFELFKREKKAKMGVAITMVIVAILVRILAFQYEGFLFNQRDLKQLNSIAEITYIVSPIILVSLSNWSVTTLFDGKGKLKEIFMMICYALYPLIICNIISMILSTFLVEDETAIYYLVNGIGIFLMLYVAFFGMICIHEYGLLKCVLTLVATLLAASVICFILLLGYDLFQKMFGFIYTIYRELTLRGII